MKRTRTPKKITDPLLRACTACGAAKLEGCKTVGKDGKPLPRVPHATRLVHAARLEEPNSKGTHA